MICPNMCYAINSNKAIYCYKCGYKFTDEDRYGTTKIFDQKKFNIYTVKVLQELLDNAENFNKSLADDFAVLCELLWTYDPEYHSSNQTAKKEEKE